ncbi:MAG: hypothetical protein CMB80_00765, partial [Flammeovirgaceae bacterium]|nr:hypothetical protein [Flammeovirgaceae bacterium]
AGVTVVLVNQERDKIGVTWGSKTTTPGGRAVKFFASLRLKIVRIGYYERGGERAGIRTQMIPVKSKLFPIFGRVADFIIGPDGINIDAALVESLIKKKVVTKSGAWISFGDRRWQGVTKFEDSIKEDQGLKSQLISALKKQGGHTSQIKLEAAPSKL